MTDAQKKLRDLTQTRDELQAKLDAANQKKSDRSTTGTELTALLRSRMQHLLEQVQDAYGPYPEGEFWVPHRLGGGAPTLTQAKELEAAEAATRAARRQLPPGSGGRG